MINIIYLDCLSIRSHPPPSPFSPLKTSPVLRAVHGDNWFRSHEAAMLNFLGDRQVEVAYADLKNSIYHRPYAILIDHKWQCVVLTIRGTLSLEDLMVDANTDAVRPTSFNYSRLLPRIVAFACAENSTGQRVRHSLFRPSKKGCLILV